MLSNIKNDRGKVIIMSRMCRFEQRIINPITDSKFKWMPYICFNTFFGILPHMGPALGALKVKKNVILGKSKMAATATIVRQRKKFRKQKSLVSMSYNWSVPKFLTSDENLKH